MSAPHGGVHPAAAVGFEREAATYALARPGYPAALLSWLRDPALAALAPGIDACDVAAGTGLFTRVLVDASARVTAVEPVAAMREQLARALPGVTLAEGTAEALPLADASLDLLSVAQAFHWFDAQPALREIWRVLRPGGRFVLVWNVRDESVDWVRAFTDVIETMSGGRPYTPPRDTSWEAIVASHGGFEPSGTGLFDNPQSMTPDGLVARALSTSFVAALPSDRQRALLDAIMNLCRTHPQLAGRDQFTMPHVCAAFVWRRRERADSAVP